MYRQTVPIALALCLLVLGACAAPATRVVAPPPLPPEAPAHGPLAETRRHLARDLQQSDVALAQGLTFSPTRAAHLRMTTAALDYIDAGDTEHALDLLERAISVDGTVGYAFVYIGYIHAREGRTEQAQAFIDRATGLLPIDPALDQELAEVRSSAATSPKRQGGERW